MTEIARAKVMSVNLVPMDVDALRFKGEGKGKSKDHKEKGKANKERCTRSKSPDPKDVPLRQEGSQEVRPRRRSLRVVLRCFLKLSTRFTKSATLLLQLGPRCALPAGRWASRCSGLRQARWPTSGFSVRHPCGTNTSTSREMNIMLKSGKMLCSLRYPFWFRNFDSSTVVQFLCFFRIGECLQQRVGRCQRILCVFLLPSVVTCMSLCRLIATRRSCPSVVWPKGANRTKVTSLVMLVGIMRDSAHFGNLTGKPSRLA